MRRVMDQSISLGGLIALFGVLAPLTRATGGMFTAIQGVCRVGAAAFAFLGGMAVFGGGAVYTLAPLCRLAEELLKLAP